MSIKLIKRGRIWHLSGTVRGIAVRESTKTADREAAEEIRIQREGEILRRSIHGAAETASFSEAVVMYLEAGGEKRYVPPLLKHFHTVPLARINQRAIEKAARVLYPAASYATHNRQVFTPMSAILKAAGADWSVKRPRIPKAETYRWLSPDEAARLLDECAPHLYPIVLFLLHTGARLSEALYLDWRNVDLGKAHVSFIKTKNGDARGVPLHPEVVAALANLKHRDGNVFRTQKGEPYRWRENDRRGTPIRTGFHAALRRAGVAHCRVHDLRHTWATWFYQETPDLLRLQKLGGWKSLAMVQRYAHVNSELDQNSINAMPSIYTKSAQAS